MDTGRKLLEQAAKSIAEAAENIDLHNREYQHVTPKDFHDGLMKLAKAIDHHLKGEPEALPAPQVPNIWGGPASYSEEQMRGALQAAAQPVALLHPDSDDAQGLAAPEGWWKGFKRCEDMLFPMIADLQRQLAATPSKGESTLPPSPQPEERKALAEEVRCIDCGEWRPVVKGNHHPWCACGSDRFDWGNERPAQAKDSKQ